MSDIVIGVLQLKMVVRGSHSLKDKRRVLKSLKDRLRHKFNISVAEVGDLENHQMFELGIAAVGNDRRFINSVLSSVVGMAESDHAAELVNQKLEII